MRRPRLARRFLLPVLATVLAASAGVAVAHNIDCYTAVGYTITCTPKAHDNDDPFGVRTFGFKTGSTSTQYASGSFYWNRIVLTDGYAYQPAWLGNTYINQANPTSQIYYTGIWFCMYVSSISYQDIGFGGTGLYNGTPQGYLDQSSAMNDCYYPGIYHDYLTWHAY
jgi:hypothetical protein